MKPECFDSVQQTALSILNSDCRGCRGRFCGNAARLLEKIGTWYAIFQQAVDCLKTGRPVSPFLCLKQVAMGECWLASRCCPVIFGVLAEVAEMGAKAFLGKTEEVEFTATGDGGKIASSSMVKVLVPIVQAADARLALWEQLADEWAYRMVPKAVEQPVPDDDEIALLNKPPILLEAKKTLPPPDDQSLRTLLTIGHFITLCKFNIRTVGDVRKLGQVDLEAMVGEYVKHRVVTRLATRGVVL